MRSTTLVAFLFASLTVNPAHSQPKINTGPLSFLNGTYSSEPDGCNGGDFSTGDYIILSSEGLYYAALPSESYWLGYYKLPFEQAVHEFHQYPGETTYQVFYFTPPNDGQHFNTIISTALLKINADGGAFLDEDPHDEEEGERLTDFGLCATSFVSPLNTQSINFRDSDSPSLPLISEVDNSAEGVNLIVVSDVSYRSGPETSSTRLGAFRKGERLKSTGFVAGWYRFNVGGRSVYSYKRYFRKANDPQTQTANEPIKLTGFSCEAASYGGSLAKAMGERITSALYGRYGCTALASAHILPGYRAGDHTQTRASGPWSGFAARNTVLYYSNNNAALAKKLAADLSARYGGSFQAQRGGGQGVVPEWYTRTIIVHTRDDL